MNTKIFGRLALAAALTVGTALFCANNLAKDNDLKAIKKVKLPKYKNEDFYQNGKFQVDKAKKAYFDMMGAYGYPVPESLRTNMWATDFGSLWSSQLMTKASSNVPFALPLRSSVRSARGRCRRAPSAAAASAVG